METEKKNDEQVRKAAKCVQYLLETEEIFLSSKDIMELIKNEDLSNVKALKSLVEKHVGQKPNGKKKEIEDYITKNWASLKDNKTILSVLINAYCLGNYNKEKRKQMEQELLSHCQPDKIEKLARDLLGE